ncbi:MAG TPA: hypothetical protein VNH18_19795 [Bryobacteraceae bacterium]|nr:hypothetical protein [Bryobacteraceae bacterium]
MTEPPAEPIAPPGDANPSGRLTAVQAAKFAFILLVSSALLLLLWAWLISRLTAFGVALQFYYVILVTLGAFAALITFGVLTAVAHYESKGLTLSGSAVVFLLVIILGYKLVPQVDVFNLTARLRDAQGNAPASGTATLLLGSDQRAVLIGGDGQAEFKQIPLKFRPIRTKFELHSAGYRLTDPAHLYDLRSDVIDVSVVQYTDPAVIDALVSKVSDRVQSPGWPESNIAALRGLCGHTLSARQRTLLIDEYVRVNDAIIELVTPPEPPSNIQLQQLRALVQIARGIQEISGEQATWATTKVTVETKMPGLSELDDSARVTRC